MSILGFLENSPQRPLKREKSNLMGSLVVLDSNGSLKKFRPFSGLGVIKYVHAYLLLNGAFYSFIQNLTFFESTPLFLHNDIFYSNFYSYLTYTEKNGKNRKISIKRKIKQTNCDHEFCKFEIIK